MRFLPIVDRELREGARRPATYWTRVSVAFMASLVGVVAFFINHFEPTLKLGTLLFWGLSGLSMISCLLAGRAATADCLSREKREGTLGLLFLTDLKAYDVVLGKLVATSLAAFYALLTILPLLAIPLLTGGMTHGEFWRMALVLVNTFFFSLAVGILASAATRQYRAAMAANFFLFALVVAVPAAGGIALSFVRGSRPLMPLFYSCPIYSFALCADALYARTPADFWWSVAATHLLGWLFVILACGIVPRSWADKPAVAASGRWRWREIGPLISFGGPAKRAAFRKQALDTSAFFWLAARARLKPVHVWVFLGLAAAWWLHSWFQVGSIWLDQATYVATAVLLNSTLKLWIALEAGSQLGEDRRSNAFELLLVTPQTVGDILDGQWRALRRQFLRPVIVVAVVELFFALALARRPGARQEIGILLAGVVLLLTDAVALMLVAVLAALTARSQTRAVMMTVSRVLVVPWIAFVGVLAALQACYLLDLMQETPNDRFTTWLWLITGLVADAVYGFRAWKALRLRFRELALRPLIRERTQFGWRHWPGKMAAAVAGLGRRIFAPRFRKPLAIFLAAVVVLAGVLLIRARPAYPKPVLVSITRTNTPIGIFPGGPAGVFLVLPDGTLWRWGMTGPPNNRHGAVPEQIGTARNWVKALRSENYCLGLRDDGTVWQWRWLDAKGTNGEEEQVDLEQKCIDIGLGADRAIALRENGKLRIWGTFAVDRGSRNVPLPRVVSPPTPRPRFQGNKPIPTYGAPVGAVSNWTAVCGLGAETMALRSDGTLWAWGLFNSYRPNWLFQTPTARPPAPYFFNRTLPNWSPTNINTPILLCADTNWISLDADGLARNRAGELWEAGSALPDPQASASSVCHLVSTNWAADHVHSQAWWMRTQVRSNGTLWAAPHSGNDPPPSAQEWRQIGSRSDWVELWGVGETSFGLTADGTLWAWGIDLGAEPRLSFGARLQILKMRLAGHNVGVMQPAPPRLEQPRPLLRLVPTK